MVAAEFSFVTPFGVTMIFVMADGQPGATFRLERRWMMVGRNALHGKLDVSAAQQTQEELERN